MGEREVFDIDEEFFNDGHWYTLTSPSLGGLSPAELSAELSSDEAGKIRALMSAGVCLPLAFDADCALDLRTRFVVGDLEGEEAAQWCARLRGWLDLSDGVFALIAGGVTESFEAINDSAMSEWVFSFELKPGRYSVELYAYPGSYTVNRLFSEGDDTRTGEGLLEWWRESRGDAPLPGWLEDWPKEGYVDNDRHELLAYVVRLAPIDAPLDDDELPALDPGYDHWVTEFEGRRPELCPRGQPFKRGE